MLSRPSISSFRVTGLKFKWLNFAMTGRDLGSGSPAVATAEPWWGTSSLAGRQTGRASWGMEIIYCKSEMSDCGGWEHSRSGIHCWWVTLTLPYYSFSCNCYEDYYHILSYLLICKNKILKYYKMQHPGRWKVHFVIYYTLILILYISEWCDDVRAFHPSNFQLYCPI